MSADFHFLKPVVLFMFWIFLKILRYGDNFEWYVKLGSWEELQVRLDRLASAIVTDAPRNTNIIETGGAVFAMNHLAPSSQRRQNGTPLSPSRRGDSGYVTPGAESGLGLRSGTADYEIDQAPRTPSPRSEQPWLDSQPARGPLRRDSPRRRPVPGTMPRPAHVEPERPQYRTGSFSARQAYDPLHPVSGGRGNVL